jgi:hypothetical protein
VDSAFPAKKIHAFVVENKTKIRAFVVENKTKKFRAFVVRAYSAGNSLF